MSRQISVVRVVAEAFDISRADAQRAFDAGGVKLEGHTPLVHPKMAKEKLAGRTLTIGTQEARVPE